MLVFDGVCLCSLKLTEEFVSTCLQDCHGFAVLVPVNGALGQGYALVVEADGPNDNHRCLERVEQRLNANPQYEHSRRMNQLQPLRLVPIIKVEDYFLEWALDRKRRLSDIKSPVLLPDMEQVRQIWPQTALFNHSKPY